MGLPGREPWDRGLERGASAVLAVPSIWEGGFGHELMLAECAGFWASSVCTLLPFLLVGS